MAFRHFCIVLLFLAFGVQPVSADSQSELKKRANSFCGTPMKLTEDSIKFDVEKIVSAGVDRNTAATVDSVSMLQIDTMRLNCRLLVGGLITPDSFLTAQTHILQFAVDLQAVRQQAELKNPATTKTNSSAPAATASTAAATPAPKTEATPGTPATSQAPTSTAPKAGKTVSSQKPANLDIDTIANALGVKLKHKTAVSQSGNEDLVQSGMLRLIQNYSPIEVNE